MISMNLLKSNLLKQMRSYKFMIVILIATILAYFCVPSVGSGFEIFHFGGVRGIYNSAWLGTMCAVLPIILLWLPTFYMLRSQISEDKRLKIGQVIAATPISKIKYIMGKAISNFVVLLVLQFIFTFSMIIMQLLRSESTQIVFMDYIKPLLFITIPYLFFLASLTVLFDVVKPLKSAFGNIMIFVVWCIFTILSVENPDSIMDLFGIGAIMSQMTKTAQVFYPSLPSDVGSFGFTVVNKESSTFLWNGLEWDLGFLLSRFIWIGISLLIILVSSIIFNRFKEKQYKKTNSPPTKHSETAYPILGYNHIKELSPVSKRASSNLFMIVKGDLKTMLFSKSFSWYLAMLSAIVINLIVPIGESYRWMSLTMLLLISTFSEMGCMEKTHNTSEIVFSSCTKSMRWISNWIAGIIVAFIGSSGVLIKLAFSGLWGNLFAWLIGCIFIATLAQTVGRISGVKKAFEACYTVIFFLGPIYDTPNMDFLGLHSINIGFTLIMIFILFMIGYGTIVLKEKANKKGLKGIIS